MGHFIVKCDHTIVVVLEGIWAVVWTTLMVEINMVRRPVFGDITKVHHNNDLVEVTIIRGRHGFNVIRSFSNIAGVVDGGF